MAELRFIKGGKEEPCPDYQICLNRNEEYCIHSINYENCDKRRKEKRKELDNLLEEYLNDGDEAS